MILQVTQRSGTARAKRRHGRDAQMGGVIMDVVISWEQARTPRVRLQYGVGKGARRYPRPGRVNDECTPHDRGHHRCGHHPGVMASAHGHFVEAQIQTPCRLPTSPRCFRRLPTTPLKRRTKTNQDSLCLVVTV